MSTNVESFANLHELGAIYPFPGSEGILTIIAVGLWIGWHVWQLTNEARELNVEASELKDKARVSKILESKSIGSGEGS